MNNSGSFFGLCLLLLNGVFGAGPDEVKKSVSVMEGDSVSLNTDITEIQSKDLILWMFGPREDRIAEIYKQNIDMFDSDVTFGDRLQMDSQTGSLTIRNIRSEHTGLYKLTVISNRGTSYKRFNVTVYARLPYPVIIRNPSNCSSSSSESRCSLVCSVLNVSDVTLSWYKGMSVLSSISASDLSISLSLPLDVEYQDKNTYNCVINNPVRNQTTHLNNITQLCHTCEALGQRSSFMTVIAVTLALLAAIAVVGGSMCHRRCKQPGKKVKRHEEEVLYTTPTFSNLQSTDIVATDQTVYSTVATYDRSMP